MSGARDVVDDDRVEALALELVARRRRPRPPRARRRSRPAPDPARRCAASVAEHVLGRLELDRVGALGPGLLELVIGAGGAGGSRRPRPPSAARRARANSRRARAGQLGRGLRPGRPRRRPAASSATLAATTVTSAPRAAAASASAKPHPAGGAVADVPDAVDRLLGAAGGDQHLHARKLARLGGRASPAASHASPQRLARGQQLRRLGQPADPALAVGGELALARRDDRDAALAQQSRRLAWVAGFRYIRLFIAGATATGQAAASAAVRHEVVGERRARAWRSCWRWPERSGRRRRARPAPGG